MQQTELALDTWSGKTSPERSAQTKARTSELSSKKPRKSQTKPPLFLDLTKESGLTAEPSWEMGGALLGEYSMHSFGVSHSVAVESRLSQILEDNPHPKYCLSVRAVMGILRRANRRGKELPNTLRRALETQGGIRRDTYGQTEIANAGEVLRTLWGEIGTEAFGEWVRRTSILVQQEKVLLCHLFERGDCRKKATITCADGEEWAATCEENDTACPMQCLWKRWEDVGTPQGRESLEQLARKLSSIVHELSRQTAPHESLMRCLRSACQGSQPMRQTLASMEKVKPEGLGHTIHGDAEKSVGSAVPILNFQGSKGNSVADVSDTMYSLNAMHGHDVHCLVQPASYGVVSKGQGVAGDAEKGVAYAIRMREGCEGGGKGPLIQTEKSGTLGTGNDQTIVTAGDAKGGVTTAGGSEVSPTIKGAPSGTAQVPAVYDARGNSDGSIAPISFAVNQRDEARDLHDIAGAVQAQPGMKQQTFVAAVDCRNGTENPDINGTLQAKPNGGTSYNLQNTVRTHQSVRRLTPLECERLQGYEDGWTNIPPQTDVTEEDLTFWRTVWDEWDDMNDKKRHTDKQIVKWLQSEPADSARYKALGNSIALPPWRFVLSRIHEQGARTMASLFDGIGGFPKIWQELDGQTLWCSEVEPFPIAVTRCHFKEAQNESIRRRF